MGRRAGCQDVPPTIEKKTVGKMGLKGVPGLNIVTVSQEPRGQQSGKGRRQVWISPETMTNMVNSLWMARHIAFLELSVKSCCDTFVGQTFEYVCFDLAEQCCYQAGIRQQLAPRWPIWIVQG